MPETGRFRPKKLFLFLFFCLTSLRAGASGYSPEELILCGADRVYILNLNDDWRTPESVRWGWRAEDSPEIPPTDRKLFAATDECKPVLDGTHLLITSSAGGVALVRKSDKSTVFFEQVVNAHSAELLPGNAVAVASSRGGDEVVIFSKAGTPRVRRGYPLKGAHGVVWDARRQVLWALGDDLIQRYRFNFIYDDPALELEKSFEIPSGGHDLFPRHATGKLFVTTARSLLEFDPESCTWQVLDKLLPETDDLKSINDHPVTGQIVYVRATQSWWSDTVRFINPETSRVIPGAVIYKARWNQPNVFSY